MTLIVFLCLLCWNFPSKMPYTDRASFGVTSFDLLNSSSPSPAICSQSNMISIETRERQSSRNGAALIPCLGSSLFLGLQLNHGRDLGVSPVHKAPFTSLQKKKKFPGHPQCSHSHPSSETTAFWRLPWTKLSRSFLTADVFRQFPNITHIQPISSAAEMHHLPDSIYRNPMSICKKPVLCDLSPEGILELFIHTFQNCTFLREAVAQPGSWGCEVRQDLALISIQFCHKIPTV